MSRTPHPVMFLVCNVLAICTYMLYPIVGAPMSINWAGGPIDGFGEVRIWFWFGLPILAVSIIGNCVYWFVMKRNHAEAKVPSAVYFSVLIVWVTAFAIEGVGPKILVFALQGCGILKGDTALKFLNKLLEFDRYLYSFGQ